MTIDKIKEGLAESKNRLEKKFIDHQKRAFFKQFCKELEDRFHIQKQKRDTFLKDCWEKFGQDSEERWAVIIQQTKEKHKSSYMPTLALLIEYGNIESSYSMANFWDIEEMIAKRKEERLN